MLLMRETLTRREEAIILIKLIKYYYKQLSLK